VAKAAGYEDIISFDMGGTTAKVCLVEGGEPSRTEEYSIGDYPIRVSALDVVEIGAGGGSIAWLDAGGILHVGPQSAGAEPGPACYGLGGEDPTVTDANVCLGRLNPSYLLGGDMKVHSDLAEKVIHKIAGQMGFDLEAAASGVVELACTYMIDAITLLTVERGKDPRDYSLVAYGGAGPLHAARLAEELEIRRVIVPPSPGTHSAWGLLTTDILHSYVQTYVTPTTTANFDKIEEVFKGLTEKGMLTLRAEGIDEKDMKFIRSVDMRYVGQWYEITTPLPEGRIGKDTLPNLLQRFHDLHDRWYAWKSEDSPTEIANLRVDAVGILPKLELRPAAKKMHSLREAVKESRKVYLNEYKDFAECTIYDRDILPVGCEFQGPAIIEEKTSTTVVPVDKKVHVDNYDNIVIEIR
jgi:N-methylhydantoinase A